MEMEPAVVSRPKLDPGSGRRSEFCSDCEKFSDDSENELQDCNSSCTSLASLLDHRGLLSCSPQLRQFDRHRFEAHNWRLVARRIYRHLQRTIDGLHQLLGVSGDAAGGWIDRIESAAITAGFGCHARPVLTVCGAPNSGKSTFINCLLGQRVLPVPSRQEDQGIVRIVYSPKCYVSFKGLKLQPEPCGSTVDLSNLIRDFVRDRLNDKERQEWLTLKEDCWMEVGVDCPLLQSGFSIVEVPEWSHEDSLYLVVNQQDHSLYQTIVYVLNGKNGISMADRKYLLDLKNLCAIHNPRISIFYLVNKIDFDPKAIEQDDNSDDESHDDEDEEQMVRRVFPRGRQLEDKNAKCARDKLMNLQVQGQPDKAVLVSLERWTNPLPEVSDEVAQRNLLYKQRFIDMERELDEILRSREVEVFRLCAEMLNTVATRLYRTFTAGHSLMQPAGRLSSPEALDQLKRLTTKVFQDAWMYLKEKRGTFMLTVNEVYRREKADIVDWCTSQSAADDGKSWDSMPRDRLVQLVQNLVMRQLQIRFEQLLDGPMKDIQETLMEKLGDLQAKTAGLTYCEQMARIIGQTVADKGLCGIGQLARLTLSVQIRRRKGRLLSMMSYIRNELFRPNARVSSPQLTGSYSLRSLAEASYDCVDVKWMTQRLFHEVEARMRQTEQAIMSAVTSKLQHSQFLQKQLAKSAPQVLRLWQDAQLCAAAADALATVANHGSLKLDPESLGEGPLGPRFRLAGLYAGFAAHEVVATVTCLWNNADVIAGGGGAIEEATMTRWREGLGGLLNHLLLARGTADRGGRRHLAVTRLLAFDDRARLCALHAPLGRPFADVFAEPAPLTDVQACELVDGLCGAFSQLTESLPPSAWTFDPAYLNVNLQSSQSRPHLLFDLLHKPAINWKALPGKLKRVTIKHRSDRSLRGGDSGGGGGRGGSSQCQQEHLMLLDLSLLVLLFNASPTDCRNLLGVADAKLRRERLQNLAQVMASQLPSEASFLLKMLLNFYREPPSAVCASLAAAMRRELSYRLSGSAGSTAQRRSPIV